jgi:hypothetical protein
MQLLLDLEKTSKVFAQVNKDGVISNGNLPMDKDRGLLPEFEPRGLLSSFWCGAFSSASYEYSIFNGVTRSLPDRKTFIEPTWSALSHPLPGILTRAFGLAVIRTSLLQAGHL